MQKTFFILCSLISFINYGMEQKARPQSITNVKRSKDSEESSLSFPIGSIPVEREKSPVKIIETWSFSPAGLAFQEELKRPQIIVHFDRFERNAFKTRAQIILAEALKQQPELIGLEALIVASLTPQAKGKENKTLAYSPDEESSLPEDKEDCLSCFFPFEEEEEEESE